MAMRLRGKNAGLVPSMVRLSGVTSDPANDARRHSWRNALREFVTSVRTPSHRRSMPGFRAERDHEKRAAEAALFDAHRQMRGVD
jgi:hypothetical protein